MQTNNKSKKISLIILAVLLIAGIVYWWHLKEIEKNAIQTPQEDPRLKELQALEASSKPVTATIQERATTLNTAEKSSKKVTTTPDQRLKDLQTLSNQ